jgi:hypothetical protein
MLNKIKSISQLYDEVKDYDLVISVDPALVTALNKCINKSTIGGFAYTPRDIASKNSIYFIENSVLDKIEVILKIYSLLVSRNKKLLHKSTVFNINNSNSSNYSNYSNNVKLSFVHNAYIKIIDVYKHTGSINQIPLYLNKDELIIFDIYKNLNTIEIAMEKFNFQEIFPNKKIAVIGLDFFTELDKNVLPINNEFDIISLFKEDEYIEKFNSFYSFYNYKELINKLVSLINKNNQNDIAIILNINLEILPIIKSKLNMRNIDLNIKSYIYEDVFVRDFISIIENSFNLNNLKVKDLIFILNLLNIEIDVSYYNYYLDSYIKKISSNKLLLEIYFILNNIKKNNFTFGKLYYFFENNSIKLPYDFKVSLYKLNLFNKKIDLDSLEELKYYITNLDIIDSKNKKGVLIVDCKNSMYIDRPVCFYIGLDNTWVSNIKSKSYKDSKIQDQKAQDKFNILIQQGDVNYYFVTKYTNNNITSPCFYFLKIFNKSITSFFDSVFNIKEIYQNKINNDNSENTNNINDTNFIENKEKGKSDVYNRNNNLSDEINYDEINNNTNNKDNFIFSKSTLNNFVLCPKKLEFYKLIDTEDNMYFRKGNLLHSFCEFYIDYKDLVIEKGIDFFVNIILDNYSSFINYIDYELEKTNFKIALMNCISFLNSLDIQNHNLNKELDFKNNSKNIFAERLNLKLKSNNTEFYFKNEKYNIKGIIDLIVNNNLIIDYKSSKSKKTTSVIFKNSNINYIYNCGNNNSNNNSNNNNNVSDENNIIFEFEDNNDYNDNDYNDNSNNINNVNNNINVDFQAIMYILNLSNLKVNKNKIIEFYYYFPFSNKNKIIKEDIIDYKDLEKLDLKENKIYESNIVKVKYIPVLFNDFISTIDFINILKISKQRDKIISKIGKDVFLNYLNKNKINIDLLNLNLNEFQNTSWYKKLFNFINKFIKTEKEIYNLCNKIYNIRYSNNSNETLFFKDDLLSFIDFIKKKQKLVIKYINSNFKYDPLHEDLCKTCNYNTICLKRCYNEK